MVRNKRVRCIYRSSKIQVTTIENCTVNITPIDATVQPLGEVTASWWTSAAARVVITLITIIGNAAVLVALKRASPRFPTHYPLASLAVADFTLGLIVLPLAAMREHFIFQPNWVICAFWSTMDVFCCTASILSLCALGWERWSGITSPLARAKRSKRAKQFAILIWPVAAAVALPTTIIPSPKHILPGEIVKACTVNTNIGYVFFSVSFSFYLPASGMMILYTRILLALASPPNLRTHRGHTPRRELAQDINGIINDVQQMQNKNNTNLGFGAGELPRTPVPSTRESNNNVDVYLSPQRCHLDVPENSRKNVAPSPQRGPCTTGVIISRQRRATQTIVTLMTVFLICWSPFFVMLPIDSLCDCVPEPIWELSTWFGYLNSALDPLVYAAGSPTVRRALHASLTLSTSSTRPEIPLTPNVRRT